MAGSRTLVWSAYSLTFLTGAAGLVYQVAWQRYLTRLLGSDSLAVATVLGVFLGGLSLGYLLCGKLTLRLRDPFKGYAAAEAIIGIWGLLFPLLFKAVDSLTGGWSFAPPWALVLQGTLCGVLLMGLPTLCMGATVPMLTRGLSSTLEQATRVHARVYAANTGGAFLGTLLAGFYLIHRFGLPGTLRIAAALNLAAAMFFALAAVRLGSRGELPDAAPTLPPTKRKKKKTAPSDARPRPAAWALYGIAFIGGVYFMTLESLLIRITNLSIGSSAYSFALIVAVFVLSIAVGSWCVARMKRISPSALMTNQLLVVVSLMLLFLTLDKWPYGAHVLRVAFSGSASAFVLYYVAAFLSLLALLLFPAGFMGATLPLAFHALKRDLAHVGSSAGVLLSWNAAGNLLGGIVGGFLIYDWLGNGEVFMVALGLAATSALLATTWLPGLPRLAAAGAALATLVFIAMFPAHDPLRFSVGTFRLRKAVEYSFAGPTAFYAEFYRSREILAYRDEPAGTFAVVQNPPPALALAERFPGLVESVLGDSIGELAKLPRPRSIVVNGKADSSTFFDLETLKLVAHLPALTAPSRDRILIVGLGTGVTAGEFALYPDVDAIEVAEISPAVVDFLPLFEKSTHRVQDDPRLIIHRGDAFRVLRRSDSTWDIIASEPSNPWMNGVDQMFSARFYRLVREHLSEDGLFLQWVQRYATNEEIASLAINTLRSEFPYARVFRTDGADDLILASMSPISDEAFERGELLLSTNPEVQQSLASIGVSGASSLLEKERPEVLSRADAYKHLGVETLDRPRIHYMAGWAFFSGQSIDNESGLLGN